MTHVFDSIIILTVLSEKKITHVIKLTEDAQRLLRLIYKKTVSSLIIYCKNSASGGPF